MAKHDRRKRSSQPPSSRTVTIQVPLPVLGVLNGVREAFHGLCIKTGMQVLEAMMEGDREDLCGPKGRHQVERPAWRGGSVASQVTLGGRQVAVPRLRVRSADGEESLPSFRWAATTDPLDEHTLAAVAAGVSTRRYAGTLDPAPAEVTERGTSSSAVSRRFVALSAKRLRSFLSRPLRELDLRVVCIDGKVFRDHCMVVFNAGWRARWWRRSRVSGGCGATATCATWSAPWTLWPRPTARLLTWRKIDDYGAETGSPSLAKFNNERDNPPGNGGGNVLEHLQGRGDDQIPVPRPEWTSPATINLTDTEMRLSGIDPGIIRELSGIYKPFVKAFKELVSNAYDADATEVFVTLSDDFSSMDVLDNGIGMTPFDFHESFARLGGSTAWLQEGTSPGGRPRIGYKGIGFLAVARYCSALQVESHSRRPYTSQETVRRRNRKTIPLRDVVGEIVPTVLLENRLKIMAVRVLSDSTRIRLRLKRDYVIDSKGVHLVSARSRKGSHLQFDYSVNCTGMHFRAVLDFDYLLSLERKADLRLLDNFCTVELTERSPQDQAYARVRLHQLKDFVLRDLSGPRIKGKARNVVSKSGKDQFLWRLARTAPIMNEIPEDIRCEPVRRLNTLQNTAGLPDLIVKWRNDDPMTLRRPVYLANGHRTPLDEGLVPIKIEQDGLRAEGYLLARSEVIYPAELRGLSIRVRHVAIGEPSFLGWEHILSGPRKAALSQITGEILVSSGLDAADAINPGRESFYEENAHYRLLRRALFGSEETMGGIVGQAVQKILERLHVRSQLTGALAGATQRRRALVQVSSAVNFYSRDPGEAGAALKGFFRRSVRANGLPLAREVSLRPEHTLAGFRLESRAADKGGDFGIDFGNRLVWIDFDQDTWSNTVYLLGDYYDVLMKQGKPDHPICEFDTTARHIYVNWGHPVKLQMDDAAFLKSAILLRLAHYAAPENGDTMMELALNMLAFRVE